MEKQIKFKLLGMDTDSDVSIINGTSSIKNCNVRFTVADEELTNAAITNERGTKINLDLNFVGTPIGYCVINDYLVLYEVASNSDYIRVFKLQDNDSIELLYQYYGNFNFKIESPIECQAVWERDDIIKVFWVDGINPLRFINIIPKEGMSLNNFVSSTYFDAVKIIHFNDSTESSITVIKQSHGGNFPAGTIQYAFTYYTKYGTESNIFKLTPLFYNSSNDSGAPADRTVFNSYKIDISDVDREGNWDYIRVYSILRTATNGESVCKRVVDISIDNFIEGNTITYIDTGSTGETIDSTRLLYVGGESIIPKTIAQKDGTLFLGNYQIVRTELSEDVKNTIRQALLSAQDSFFNTYYTDDTEKHVRKVIPIINEDADLNSPYTYSPQLSNSQNKITTFKTNETYRIGIQLQDSIGKWSDPIFLFDSINKIGPSTTSTIGSYIVDSISELNQSENSKTVKTNINALLAFGHLRMNLNEISYGSSNILNYLKSLGYCRIRPVIVYPKEECREVLFQGIANPTIRKGTDWDDYDYRISSWYFRALPSNTTATTGNNTGTNYGAGNRYYCGPSFKGVHPTYHHGYQIPYYKYDQLYGNALAEFQYETDDKFWIDWRVITIDSPDLRFNEQLSHMSFKDTKLRVVGFVDLAGNAASYSINIEGSTEPPEKLMSSSLINTLPRGNNIVLSNKYLSGNINSLNYGACLVNYPLWIDGFSDRGEKGYDQLFAQWYVYPWQRNGSLNNCSSVNMNNIEGAARPSMLKRKIMANSRFGYNTVYGEVNNPYSPLSIDDGKVFLQDSESQITRFLDGSLYKNSVDLVLSASGLPSFRAVGKVYNKTTEVEGQETLLFSYGFGVNYATNSYSFNITDNNYATTNAQLQNIYFGLDTNYNEPMRYYDPKHDGLGNDNDYHIGNDPIPMQFKTGTNCVLSLPNELYYNGFKFNNDPNQFFSDLASGHWLPLVEVYREIPNKFGGSTEDALQQAAWSVAGTPVLLKENIDLFWDYGDTYFQRYDCLKTMPYSDSSINNIIEILSFFCESRVNIDGRYDLNRGLEDNTVVTKDNFNLLNDAYTQSDNYFQYYINDSDLSQINEYPTQVLWSLIKTSGDTIDPWTNITLLNSINLDGSKGAINAIKNFNGQLYTFQDSGIAMLNYNQNVMINSEAGVPIEISNSEKVTGSTYISTSIGCINKWTIADINQGLVFVDSLNKKLNIFDGNQIVNLGEKANFQAWIKTHCGSTDSWNPLWENIDGNTLTVLYDKDAEELLLTGKDFSVAYNLGLMKFTSFYNYEESPWIINLNHNQFIIHKDRNNLWKSWNLRQGNYNEFFGVFKPYYIEFIATDSQYFDYMKLFSTIEIRDTVTASKTDTYGGEFKGLALQDSFSFDHIRVTNSYQDSGTELLEYKKCRPSNMKAKFRTWRINVPRNKNTGSGRIRDRIKDHYMKVELSHLNQDYNPIKVHDIITTYMV